MNFQEKRNYPEKKTRPIDIEDCEIGDHIRFTNCYGDVLDGIIREVNQFKNKLGHFDWDIKIEFPRVNSFARYLNSNIRIDRILDSGVLKEEVNMDNYYLLLT